MLRFSATETEFFLENSVSTHVPLVPMESESRSFGTRILDESGLALSFYMSHLEFTVSTGSSGVNASSVNGYGVPSSYTLFGRVRDP